MVRTLQKKIDGQCIALQIRVLKTKPLEDVAQGHSNQVKDLIKAQSQKLQFNCEKIIARTGCQSGICGTSSLKCIQCLKRESFDRFTNQKFFFSDIDTDKTLPKKLLKPLNLP